MHFMYAEKAWLSDMSIIVLGALTGTVQAHRCTYSTVCRLQSSVTVTRYIGWTRSCYIVGPQVAPSKWSWFVNLRYLATVQLTAFLVSQVKVAPWGLLPMVDFTLCGFRTTAGWWNDLMVETFAYVWHVGSYFKLSTFHARESTWDIFHHQTIKRNYYSIAAKCRNIF